MNTLTYFNGIARAMKDDKLLENRGKPYLSFDFDELYFNQKNKYLILDSKEYTLKKEQIEEIESFIENIEEDEDLYTINKLLEFLHKTDWMVIREMETGKKMPDFIKKEREAYRQKISELKLKR